MRSDESRVSKSRASSPDGRGATPPISEPFPINPQTSASPNAGQPLAMQKRVRQTIITQQHRVQLPFFRNAGLSAELCRLAWVSSQREPNLWIRRLTTAPTSRGATGPGPPASHADPKRAATAAGLRRNRRETTDTWPRQPNPGSPAPRVALIEAPPCTCGTSELHSERRGRVDNVPSITFPDRIEDPEVVNEHWTAQWGRHPLWRPV